MSTFLKIFHSFGKNKTLAEVLFYFVISLRLKEKTPARPQLQLTLGFPLVLEFLCKETDFLKIATKLCFLKSEKDWAEAACFPATICQSMNLCRGRQKPTSWEDRTMQRERDEQTCTATFLKVFFPSAQLTDGEHWPRSSNTQEGIDLSSDYFTRCSGLSTAHRHVPFSKLPGLAEEL